MYEVNVKGYSISEYVNYEKTILFAFADNALTYAKKIALAADVTEVNMIDGFTGEVLWNN